MDLKNQEIDDVALKSPGSELEFKLEEVGLENVQTVVQTQGLSLPAQATAKVSLVDPKSRGIHMSRLFRLVNGLNAQELSFAWLSTCLEQMLASQGHLSDRGSLEVKFDRPVLKDALKSAEKGWRNYPLSYRVATEKNQQPGFYLSFAVLYSSTCPCSSSLSRAVLKESFLQNFKEEQVSSERVAAWLGSNASMVAAPHAQRSEARCELKLDKDINADQALKLVSDIEHALGTPVQAAVKREDEMEFARLNAQNQMFCEDAARKIKSALNKKSEIKDFKIEVRHFESLHAHDVVAKASKF
jgi:GTP cyclohydrolase I